MRHGIILGGGGGGADTSVVTATAADVLKDKVIVGADGEPLTGTLALSGDATAANVLSGKTFYNTNAKSKVTGSMTNQGAKTASYTPSTAVQSYTIPAGYHNGSGKVTIKAIPSSYVSISGGITFFKDGAFGQIVTNLGIGKYRPYAFETVDSEGWYPVKTWVGDKSAVTLTRNFSTPYPFTPSSTANTNEWCTRKTINFDSISRLETNVYSGNANKQNRWWFYNVDKQKCKFFNVSGTTESINISSVTGNCIFGCTCLSGVNQGSSFSSVIFY